SLMLGRIRLDRRVWAFRLPTDCYLLHHRVRLLLNVKKYIDCFMDSPGSEFTGSIDGVCISAGMGKLWNDAGDGIQWTSCRIDWDSDNYFFFSCSEHNRHINGHI